MEGEGVDFMQHSKNWKILEYSPSQSSTTYTSGQLLLFSHLKKLKISTFLFPTPLLSSSPLVLSLYNLSSHRLII